MSTRDDVQLNVEKLLSTMHKSDADKGVSGGDGDGGEAPKRGWVVVALGVCIAAFVLLAVIALKRQQCPASGHDDDMAEDSCLPGDIVLIQDQGGAVSEGNAADDDQYFTPLEGAD